VQAESPGALPGLVFLDEAGAGADLARAGRIRAGNAAIVRRPGGAHDNASLWVAAGYGGYRGAYGRFLQHVYGERASEAELNGWDIDHLLNRARAPDATCFVRVEAIPASANRQWGSLFEKVASDPRFFANRERKRGRRADGAPRHVLCLDRPVGGRGAPRRRGDARLRLPGGRSMIAPARPRHRRCRPALTSPTYGCAA
jgi:hypothetical protein